MADIALTGAGWAHHNPLHNGSVTLWHGEEVVARSIRLILGTRLGGRSRRPEFGCGVHDLLFDPLNSGTAGAAVYEARKALDRWEPRIVVDDITAEFSGINTLLLSIDYRISEDNSPRNLVYPYYTIYSEAPEATQPSL
ncbi:GPW/gp25 family protein [Streptomyces sp. NPDC092307]|uniref:GPW/gp25 family protein n=1 Tax=Streptomyces sp. NPDC092307 TaxID=3366013 RepID=UPI00380A1F0F